METNILKRSANSLNDLVNHNNPKISGFTELNDESLHNYNIGDIELQQSELQQSELQQSELQLSNNSLETIHTTEHENDQIVQKITILKRFCSICNILISFFRSFLNNCQQNEKWKKFMSQVIHYYTHFLLFVIFEILFYFNYIAPYEQKLVYNMLNSVLDDIIDNPNVPHIPIDDTCSYYSNVCSNFVDGRTNEHNIIIYQNALYLIYGLSGFLVLLVVIETNIFLKKSNFPKEFMKSTYLMIYVGIFDYLLFNFFILEYKIIDPPKIMCELYKSHC